MSDEVQYQLLLDTMATVGNLEDVILTQLGHHPITFGDVVPQSEFGDDVDDTEYLVRVFDGFFDGY